MCQTCLQSSLIQLVKSKCIKKGTKYLYLRVMLSTSPHDPSVNRSHHGNFHAILKGTLPIELLTRSVQYRCMCNVLLLYKLMLCDLKIYNQAVCGDLSIDAHVMQSPPVLLTAVN